MSNTLSSIGCGSPGLSQSSMIPSDVNAEISQLAGTVSSAASSSFTALPPLPSFSDEEWESIMSSTLSPAPVFRGQSSPSLSDWNWESVLSVDGLESEAENRFAESMANIRENCSSSLDPIKAEPAQRAIPSLQSVSSGQVSKEPTLSDRGAESAEKTSSKKKRKKTSEDKKTIKIQRKLLFRTDPKFIAAVEKSVRDKTGINYLKDWTDANLETICTYHQFREAVIQREWEVAQLGKKKGSI